MKVCFKKDAPLSYDIPSNEDSALSISAILPAIGWVVFKISSLIPSNFLNTKSSQGDSKYYKSSDSEIAK